MRGIGIDIVQISRLNDVSDSFVDKVLSKEEKALYQKFEGSRQKEFLAGRFAGKEAIIKCLSDYETPLMSDLIILNDEKGKPYIKYKAYDILISISHEKEYAVAIAYLN